MSTEAEIIAWAALVEQKVKAHYVTSPHANPSISVQWGKRYARIVDRAWGGESAYCFVEIAKATATRRPPGRRQRSMFVAISPIQLSRSARPTG